ncbi:MAG TPA: ABC transporter permease [Vicinamibacterales bacterium]|nr:ABC transporter permease [Vicinamibacterales bacterium]
MALPLSYNIRSILVRWKVTLLALGGIALVVTVLVALTAMANGFRMALRSTGSPENAIVTQRGSGSELSSGFSRETASLIMVDERIQRDAQGRPMASPEVVVVAALPRKDTGTEVNVTVRGVSPMAFVVRQGVEIVRGRRFTEGLYELIIGQKVAERYGLDVGSALKLQRQTWQVVGVFAAGGNGFESEIWGDVETVAPAFLRAGGYQSLTVRLEDPATLEAFNADLQRNPNMQVQATSEYAYYEGQAGQTAATLTYLAIFVGVVMGIGAIFGAMNTMYALVAARTREIGTLRALGFSRSAILLAFMIESAILALAGGVIGAILALPINSLSGATGGANFSEIAFAFRVSPPWLAAAVAGAVVMGLLGGLLPAFRAARTPITAALREV